MKILLLILGCLLFLALLVLAYFYYEGRKHKLSKNKVEINKAIAMKHEEIHKKAKANKKYSGSKAYQKAPKEKV